MEDVNKILKAIKKGSNFNHVSRYEYTFSVDNTKVGVSVELDYQYQACISVSLNGRTWHSELTKDAKVIANIMRAIERKAHDIQNAKNAQRSVENSSFWGSL